MKHFIAIIGLFIGLGLLLNGCDSSLSTNNSELNTTAGESQTKVLGAQAYIQGNVVTVTENDLGPSERPEGFGEEGYEAPEYKWYTPTHGDNPLNTEGATFGFDAGPDNPETFGNGSFLFDVPAGERSWILTDQYGTGEWHGEPDAKKGTRLDEITTLAYSTFISNELSDGSLQTATVVPSMQIMAQDSEGNFLPLIFDPQGNTLTGEWQRWNAIESAGWRTEDWASCEFDDGSTWSQVTEACEDAKVLWAIGIAAGTWPNQDFHGYTDLLTVGVDGEETTYDFEVSPATKQDCKRGGWQGFDFRNQGQCIRFVNTGKDSR